MRKILIAANWKMQKTIAEGEAFVVALKPMLGSVDKCDMMICPPFFAVPVVANALSGTGVVVGAQDLYWEPSGAFTGEISAAMIKDAGGRSVIIGHSERRHVLGETNEDIAKKFRAALNGGLTPVFCVGEKLEHREAGQAESFVRSQLESALSKINKTEMSKTVVAYEPVWAIGTGKTATPDDAQAMHQFIRAFIAEQFDDGVASNIRILYGGSVKPANAAELLARPDIDGALVGGASLDVESFVGIARAAQL